MKASETLRKAANTLNADNWCTEQWMDCNGKSCIEGHIGRLKYDDAYGFPKYDAYGEGMTEEDSQLYNYLLKAISNRGLKRTDGNEMSAIWFNDKIATGVDDVIALLNEAATLAEENNQ